MKFLMFKRRLSLFERGIIGSAKHCRNLQYNVSSGNTFCKVLPSTVDSRVAGNRSSAIMTKGICREFCALIDKCHWFRSHSLLMQEVLDVSIGANDRRYKGV